jgi:hypothetical protein
MNIGFVAFSLIQGVTIGLEFIWEIRAIVINLAIFRIVIGTIKEEQLDE